MVSSNPLVKGDAGEEGVRGEAAHGNAHVPTPALESLPVKIIQDSLFLSL